MRYLSSFWGLVLICGLMPSASAQTPGCYCSENDRFTEYITLQPNRQFSYSIRNCRGTYSGSGTYSSINNRLVLSFTSDTAATADKHYLIAGKVYRYQLKEKNATTFSLKQNYRRAPWVHFRIEEKRGNASSFKRFF